MAKLLSKPAMVNISAALLTPTMLWTATTTSNQLSLLLTTLYFSQFVFDYDAAGSDFDNVGTITLRADNGRYIAPHSGMTIKPLSTTPHKFILLVAQSANSAAPNGGAEGYIAYYI